MKIPVLVYILNTYREYDLKFLCFTHTFKIEIISRAKYSRINNTNNLGMLG